MSLRVTLPASSDQRNTIQADVLRLKLERASLVEEGRADLVATEHLLHDGVERTTLIFRKLRDLQN